MNRMEKGKYAQVTLEEVFRPIFRYERKMLAEGKIAYVEVDRTPRTTGIKAFDAFLRALEAGHRTVSGIAREMGVNQQELSGLVHLVTGIPAGEFISAYQMHEVSLLLRYTDMTAKEIARHCRLGTPANVAQRLQDTYGESISQHRDWHREEYDLGRFVLQMPGEK